jgi:chemotaxis protein histidine kinase CheA
MVLHMLQKSHNSSVLIKEFRKVLASMSTGALEAGLEDVVELCHSMELLIALLQRSDEQHREEINELLGQSYEQLGSLVDQYIHRETITPVEELVLRISKRLTEPDDEWTHGISHEGSGEQIALRDPRPVVPGEHGPGRPETTKGRKFSRPSPDIRDRTEEHVDRMDDMQHAIDDTYELLRSYIDELKHETGQLRKYIHIARSSSASGHSENGGDDDSLLGGYLDESDRTHDQNLQQLNQLGQYIEQQRQIIASMKAGLRQARIVSIESRINMLEHFVRHKADEQSKNVTLNVIGQHIRLDRILLDNLIGPLKCLIGYCIEHGIEVPGSRVNSGKPRGGTITLEFTKQGLELVIHINDDGIAIDSARLRQRAMELGYIPAKEPFTKAGLSMLIFNGNFSRESNLAVLKSSGIALSDVARIVKAMGGDVTYKITAVAGNGFTIHVPCELDVLQALTLQIDSEIYAFPMANVDDVLYLDALEIDTLRSLDEQVYKYKGHTYQFRNLAMVLGFEQKEIIAGGDTQYPVILVSMGNKHIALQVDQIKGQREVIVNQPVPEFNRVKVISGATLLSDKRLVLVLELGALLGEDVGNLKAIRQLSIT